jgi:hypothetical protein
LLLQLVQAFACAGAVIGHGDGLTVATRLAGFPDPPAALLVQDSPADAARAGAVS